MKLQTAIPKTFARRNVYDLPSIYRKIRNLTQRKYSDDYLEDIVSEYLGSDILLGIAANWDTGKIIYREQLFSQTCFKIGLSTYEFQEKKLFIGHRFMPFIQANVPNKNIKLQDTNGNSIPFLQHSIPVEEAAIYVSLMAPYSVNVPKIVGESSVNMDCYDLKDWMEAEEFEERDMLLIVPVDYSKYRFRLEKVSARHLAEQTFITQHKDHQLTEAIETALDHFSEPVPTDLCLFWAYTFCSPKLVKEPGTPFGSFISTHKDLTFHNFGVFTFIHYRDYEETSMEEALMENVFRDTSEMGKATDMSGILEELGNGYTENFIVGRFILQLHQNNRTDKASIPPLLFKKHHQFYNDQQEQNFNRALKKLENKVKKVWQKKRFPISVQRLLAKVIDLQISMNNGLRQIDANLTDMQRLDMKALGQLKEWSFASEQILDFILDSQVSSDEAAKLIPQMENMKVEFQKGVEYIVGRL